MKRLFNFPLIVGVLSLLLLAGQVWGTTYTIGPGQTYETFSALDTAINLAGDDIVDGGNNTFTETITLTTSGSSGHQITLRNMAINGGGARNFCVDLAQQDYITFDNVDCTGATTSGYYLADNSGTSTGIIIKNSNITATAKRGIGIWGAHNITIQDCTISNITGTNHDTEGDGIYVDGEDDLDPSTGIVISGNVLTGDYYRTPLVLVNCSGCTVSGNTITPSSVGLTMVVDFEPDENKHIIATTFSGNTVTYDFTVDQGYGLAVSGDTVTIDDITISGNTFNIGGNLAHGIYLKLVGNSSGATITANTLTGSGANINSYSANSKIISITKNRMIGSRSWAAVSCLEGITSIAYNIIEDSDNGFFINSAKTGYIYDNTVSLSSTSGYGVWNYEGNATIKNNIFSMSGTNIDFIRYVTGGSLTISNNLYYSPNDTGNRWLIGETSYNTLAAWVAAASETNSQEANPLLTSTYALGAGSPAIDAGVAITGLHTGSTIVGGDMAGNTRLYGRGVDIGAYERKKRMEDDLTGDMLPKYYTVP